MRKLAWAALMCLILLPTTCSAAKHQQQIPPKSLEALQEMFADVRDGLWEKNDDFWHHGDYERCIATMRLITEIDPRDKEAYADAAWLMQNQFRDDEAEAFLLTGLRNNSDTYDLYFELGQFYYMHVRFEEAINYMEAASTFECPFFVRNQLAHAYEHAGYTGAALDIWTEMEYLEPDFVVPRNQIDRILRGGPMERVPELNNQWRKERQEREGK